MKAKTNDSLVCKYKVLAKPFGHDHWKMVRNCASLEEAHKTILILRTQDDGWTYYMIQIIYCPIKKIAKKGGKN